VSALLDRPYRGYDSYDTSSSIARGMDAVLDQVRGFVEGGDSANALLLLEAITDEYVASWQDFDDSYGNLGGVFDGLGELWAEALLAAELSPDELEEWAEQLAEWGGDTADHGPEYDMRLAQKAAMEGWHDPLLVRVLRGEASSGPAPGLSEATRGSAPGADDEDEGWDDELDEDEEGEAEPPGIAGVPPAGPSPKLALIRLRILERQGRLEEYLNLAAAYGLQRERALMLARLGRVEEAVQAGIETLTSAADALALARALHEGGQLDAALRVAEHGLSLSGQRGPWVTGWPRSRPAWVDRSWRCARWRWPAPASRAWRATRPPTTSRARGGPSCARGSSTSCARAPGAGWLAGRRLRSSCTRG
jgi:hypothetical protein